MAIFARNTAYWDRTEYAVRDWSTGTELPGYEGPCLVYFDLRGPTMMHTFLQEGKRCWQEIKTPSRPGNNMSAISRGNA